jgi:hypothetical protein
VTNKFIVGQNVRFMPGIQANATAGPYEICRLMPEIGSTPTPPRYRIKSVKERHERVASESDLTPWDGSLHVLN